MSTYTDQRLDSGSYVPLYVQLVQLLQSAIEQGSLKAGDQLPSERELVERYGVSRITASNALQEVVRSGLAYRRHGLGTFVARPKIRDLSGFASFSDDMRERGLTPSSRLLALEFLVPDEEVASALAWPLARRASLLSSPSRPADIGSPPVFPYERDFSLRATNKEKRIC